jgi:hypothetical protein
MMSSTISISSQDPSGCCGGQDYCTIGRNASICKTEELHDKLLSGQRPSLQKDEKHDGEFNAQGRMAQDYEITNAPVDPIGGTCANTRGYRLGSLGVFFLALGTPETYPGITGGIFVSFSPEPDPFLSKRTQLTSTSTLIP